MSECRNPAHYPQPVSPGEYDAHLHAAGRVELAGGVPAVVAQSACICPTFDGEQARSFFCPDHRPYYQEDGGDPARAAEV